MAGLPRSVNHVDPVETNTGALPGTVTLRETTRHAVNPDRRAARRQSAAGNTISEQFQTPSELSMKALLRPAAFSYLGRTVTCVLFAILFPAVLQWTSVQRTAAFARASVNGAPIIAALKEYRSDNGKYPNSLNTLVPAYVSALPATGLIGYPEFTYRNGYNDSSAVSDSYELRINCPSGTINFDRFVYWPSEEYPERIQGNRTELIGSWVYVHE